ncbi:MAG: 4-hydroxythreonine-4-phosphate dehydrogenase PdxA [Planctomycetota bacterium JB042]
MASGDPPLNAASFPVRLAVTAGDPAGIGPEIRESAIAALGEEERAGVDLVPIGETTPPEGPRGPSARSGEAAAAGLVQAIDLALAGEVDGVVTAPLSKEALRLAGHPWPGQTEVLIERSGVARGVMLFVGGGLKVALATRHVPLREVADRLDERDLARDLVLLDRGLRLDFSVDAPRIGVCGVNPHAGVGGLCGTEEGLVRDASARARRDGVRAEGPFPADTLFVRQRRGEFDAVLAMYHDQGLVPVKLLGFGHGVNVTLGLPFVRTSPDHGTAYDIAGKGVADPGSMLEALRLAVGAARARRAVLNRGAEAG